MNHENKDKIFIFYSNKGKTVVKYYKYQQTLKVKVPRIKKRNVLNLFLVLGLLRYTQVCHIGGMLQKNLKIIKIKKKTQKLEKK